MLVVWDFIKNLPWERVVNTIILFAISLIVVKIILELFDLFAKRSKMDELVAKILRIVCKMFLWFIAVIIALSNLGVAVSSLIATLSIVGVAFSLAIQDFLSNVFGGFEIVSNHPFKVGDYVEIAGVAGSVCEVGLFYTKLTTPDKKVVQIPNGKVVTDSIINYSSSPFRRIEFLIATSYDDDVENVRQVLLDLISKHVLVLQDDESRMPVVHVKEFRDSDILYTARAWCNNQDYWTVYFDIMDAIKPTFDKEGITFTYPHVNVHMQND
jgi:small conductance mechanosensitive channel